MDLRISVLTPVPPVPDNGNKLASTLLGWMSSQNMTSYQPGLGRCCSNFPDSLGKAVYNSTSAMLYH